MYSANKTKNISIYIITALFIILIVAFPEKASLYSKNGLLVWYENVFPIMFPFLTAALFSHKIGLSYIISKIFEKPFSKIFSLNGYAAFALLCAALSGYPAGAKITASLISEKKVSLSEGKKILALCDVTSAAFIIGAVGANMFKSKETGMIIFLCHYISAFILCLFIRSEKSQTFHAAVPKRERLSFALSESVLSAGDTLISICCFIVIFSVISGLLTELILYLNKTSANNTNILKITVISFIEITNGCKLLSFSQSPLNVGLACAAISFGGLCIYFQILNVLNECDIKPSYILFIKAAHSAVSILVFLIFAVIKRIC